MALIDREDVIEVVSYGIELCDKALDSNTLGGRDRYAVETERNSLLKLKDDIKCLPTIPERKTGQWIDDCECSVCHWINEDDGGDTLLTYYNYCPNCGAKMDGGEQE